MHNESNRLPFATILHRRRLTHIRATLNYYITSLAVLIQFMVWNTQLPACKPKPTQPSPLKETRNRIQTSTPDVQSQRITTKRRAATSRWFARSSSRSAWKRDRRSCAVFSDARNTSHTSRVFKGNICKKQRSPGTTSEFRQGSNSNYTEKLTLPSLISASPPKTC